jgi:hypothetical protein
VNNYGYESERRREKNYFRVYRSIAFFTGFVECQEQGLEQQQKMKKYEQLLRQYRESSVIDKRWFGGIAFRVVVFHFSIRDVTIFSSSSNDVASSRRKF